MSLTRRLDRLEADAKRRALRPITDLTDAELTAYIEAELAQMTEAEIDAFWREWEEEHSE